MMLATICTFKALSQTSFCLTALYLADGILKKYSDQPVLSGLVDLLNLNISQGVTAFNSLAITPIDLRIVKRRNRSFPIGIQKIDPPLQHQLTLIQIFRFMDYTRPALNFAPCGSSDVQPLYLVLFWSQYFHAVAITS